MMLSDRQLATLRMIGDVFAPGDGSAIPSATQLGSEELALRLLGRNPRKADLRMLRLALDLWDRRGVGWLVTGTTTKFSALTDHERQQVMLRLAHSSMRKDRVLFAALRNFVLGPYYMEATAEPDSAVSAALGQLPPAASDHRPIPGPLTMTKVSADTEMNCDVVVVGSGSGGGVAAAVLARAGLDVIVIEAGGYYHETDFDGTDRSGLHNLYASGPLGTAEGQVTLAAGSCVGGGTVVNYTTCFRTPEHIRAEWASYGARQFATGEYDFAVEAVWNRLSVNLNHTHPAPRDQFMELGLRRLGWNVGATARNVLNCDMGVVCGRCAMGCSRGAKQSTATTWLADATIAGARIVPNTRAHRIATGSGRAQGIIAYTTDGHQVQISARAVVVAAGAIQTPALLKRSGFANQNIGRHLRLHPAAVVWGRTDHPVTPWLGSMQSRYSDQHSNLDGQGHGVLYETAPLSPTLASVVLPWQGGRQHWQAMKQLHRLAPLGVIVRDKGAGQVKIDRHGEPVVRYQLSSQDTAHLMAGIEGAAQILEAAGAQTVIGPHHQPISFEPGRRGTYQTFAQACRRAGAKPGALPLTSLHLMGTARMGSTPQTSAVDADGQAWEATNVVVADGSCFPTASGVNPMISIQAIAYMNATRLAARLTKN
ncbi:oxidoreductase GMC-type [Mycobacteroides abscessus subsp. bolletii]|uniref:GMC family oxidoreductase N-terminal domain-containing protein n=1 Tax=Mycobacteroides abscessus TaxID=36809 RepID=UPI00092612E1|nr:GMC family oxidoreductase N-terminal domain-containing protein [Mycobacteroides abscessus]SIJ06714.1 oxidoreductase GMC-type [Mycobacteroides abscessus subsp. bolletii]SLD79167.1 oxidoreductase GMC-type [Mycobacteroides abscessus subsp. bolletii]SLD86394.1 oxidoreductase GMC-type [Mycobacteroides abscessus subsp. bolletii]